MPGSSIAGRTDCQPVSYCLAIHTDHGLVFASDSRTHGGVDQVNTYSKMHRFVTPSTPLADAARCALVSLDSTIRSNLAVGAPVELAIYEKDTFRFARYERYEADSRFFQDLQASWSATVAQGMRDLPRFPWEGPDLFDSP